MSWIGPAFDAGAGGAASVIGNGVVVHNNGQLFGRQIIGAGLRLDNGDGIDGPPVIHAPEASRLIGVAKGLNGNSIADQIINILGADRYVIRRVVFANAAGVPSGAMAGGMYTLPSKAGKIVVPAGTVYTSLADAWKIHEITVAFGEQSAAPFLYFSLTTANGAALTLDAYVYADVLEGPIT